MDYIKVLVDDVRRRGLPGGIGADWNLDLEDVDEAEVKRIVGILLTNSFETASGGQQMTSSGTIGRASNEGSRRFHNHGEGP